MVGPDNRYVAAARLDTGAAIAVPEHLEQRGWFEDQFRILRASDAGEVEAFWDPRTGEVRDFYRHTSRNDGLSLRELDGDRVVYWLPGQDQAGIGSFWRVDLASGERERLLTGVGMASFRLNETKFFEVIPRAR
ncbi:hypothetical protein [Nannocystis bainbridge]|uniref:S9 family peptidase n=1 Tax=Nannocystis bainbridge TaxID=2995303 RepID=A0ABT5DQ76_9BACT|nr:hypothetical protein [Nannocystis bainbridge]MDC0715812.1 hypothetical protein [Nannocystis bainbridge]